MVVNIFDIFSIYILVEAVWLILPAYAANGLALLARGKRRLDFGKNFIDGRPLLGSGKTIEGFVLGCTIGAVIGLVQQTAFPYLPWGLSDRSLTIVPMTLLLGFMLGFGALLGDSAGSFIKRRLNLKRGQRAPLLDQLDFLIGAFLVSSLLIPLKVEWFILLFVLTPVFHWAACAIGYLLKLKKEPW